MNSEDRERTILAALFGVLLGTIAVTVIYAGIGVTRMSNNDIVAYRMP